MLEDITQPFASLESWGAFVEQHPYLVDRDYIEKIVAHAQRFGTDSRFWGRVPPERIEIISLDYREHLVVNGLSSRQRAVLELMAREPGYHDGDRWRIYAAEAVSALARALRYRFPRFLGSEYVTTDEARAGLFPIPYQDLTALDFPDGIWHCVLTTDCLEHIPDIDRCLAELARVLCPGGVMLSTFPFSDVYESTIKARLHDGIVEHLMEPDYHSNPAEPELGSLVFEIPGWNILDRARAAGFSKAEMVFVGGLERAITAFSLAGVWVLRCYR